MKKKFNVLCTIVFIILAINLGESLYYAGLGAAEGMEIAINRHRMTDKTVVTKTPVVISFLPTEAMTRPDSVVNTVTGKKTGVMAAQAMLWVDKEVAGGVLGFIAGFLALGSCVLMLLIMWHFFNFIRNINRMEIFTWKNVNLLETMGGLLVTVFVMNIGYTAIQYWQVSQVFALEGRIFDFLTPLTDSTLILGVLAMITGEVFAMGLRLKKDQELTI